jgi:hypothetical protein
MAEKTELMQGTLDMLVLRTLRGGALHGYAIANRIQAQSDGLLPVEEARSILPCTVWSVVAGSRPNGGSPNRSARLSTTS